MGLKDTQCLYKSAIQRSHRLRTCKMLPISKVRELIVLVRHYGHLKNWNTFPTYFDDFQTALQSIPGVGEDFDVGVDLTSYGSVERDLNAYKSRIELEMSVLYGFAQEMNDETGHQFREAYHNFGSKLFDSYSENLLSVSPNSLLSVSPDSESSVPDTRLSPEGQSRPSSP